MNPEDFLQNELKAVYPRFSMLTKLPLDLTVQFYPNIKRRWLDRNIRSMNEVIKSSGICGTQCDENQSQEQLSDEQHFEIEAWLRKLNDMFIELAALKIRGRYKDDVTKPE